MVATEPEVKTQMKQNKPDKTANAVAIYCNELNIKCTTYKIKYLYDCGHFSYFRVNWYTEVKGKSLLIVEDKIAMSAFLSADNRNMEIKIRAKDTYE